MLGKLLDLLYPSKPYCRVCGERLSQSDAAPVCRYCWEDIVRIRAPVCGICGKPLGLTHKGSVCEICTRYPHYFKQNCAVGAYDGTLRDILHLLKYKGKKELAVPLGNLITACIREQEWQFQIQAIIPVPLHRQRYAARGYNQAALLARQIGGLLGVPVWENVLYRFRRTLPQSRVSHDERFKNIHGAFRIKNDQKIVNKTLLLTDDIYTTGVTLDECACVLKAAGSGEIYCITAAIGC